MKQELCSACVCIMAALSAMAAEPITFDSLLQEMVDIESIARWPKAEYVCSQASSYDRAKIAPDKPGWFSNNDNTNYIRVDRIAGRQENVMMDAEGPGALVRFWLTAGGEKEGVLRIYLDGNPAPTLVFPSFDLLQGDLKVGSPLAHPHPGYSSKTGGNNLYLPIPYAKHCKVTWEEKSQGQRYYQINYRTYPSGTPVKTLVQSHIQSAKPLIDEVNQKLESDSQFVPGTITSFNEVLAAGTESRILLPTGPHAARSISLRLESDDRKEVARALRSIILKFVFDDETTVWCPATDFFGTAVGINPLRSWYRHVGMDGAMRCRWVMPYAKSARISLINAGARPVKATLHATTSPWVWDDRSMHFHAAWHYEAGLKTPPVTDWNFTRINGRGVYAGDSLALFNPVATWYGEGNEKIWVDGEAFPSHMGTGTEDYYGYSYAPKGIIQTPFNNHIRVDEPMTQGWNVMSRTRQLDGIPFRKSFQFDMELMAWKPTALTYAATTYWYAFSDAKCQLQPQLKEAALPIPTLAEAQAAALAALPRKPGAIECEDLKILNKSGGFRIFAQDMSPWGSDRWSGGHHLTVMASKAGDFIEVEVPVKDSKPQEVILQATRAPDFGRLAFTVQGTLSGTVFDGYADKVQPAEPLRLGVFTPANGRMVVRVHVTDANPKSTGARFFFGLDCVNLEVKP